MRIAVFFTLLVAVLLSPIIFSRGFIANAGDMHLHYYPLKHYTTARIISGELPLWNPYTFGGTPHLANPQAGVFYPGNLLFYFFGAFAAFKIWVLVHLVFMAVSFYALYKNSPVLDLDDDVSSFAGAAVVSLSSFTIYMIPAGHVVRLAGFSWLPAVALFASRFARAKRDNAPSPLAVSVISASLGFQFLSGHPQGAFMSAAVVAALFALSGVGGFKRLSAVAALAFSLSAAQYIPSAEFAALAEKISWRPLARAFSLGASDFAALAAPWKWGNPLDGNLSTSYSHFFERKNLFMGYSGLLLAVSGFMFALKECLRNTVGSRPVYGRSCAAASAFALCGIFGLIMAFGFNAPGFGFIYDRMPFLSSFRTPSRFYFLTIASAGFFAAYAARKIPRREFRVAVAAIVCAELIVWNLNFIRPMTLAWSAAPTAALIGKNDRIFTSDEIPANLSMMTRLQNLNGYDALILSGYFRDFYSRYAPAKPMSSTFLAPSSVGEIYFRDFPGWGMKYILTTENISRDAVPAATFGKVRMYKKKTVSPRIFFRAASAVGRRTPPPSIWAVEYGHEKIRITLPHADAVGGTLILGESYYPGWRAWIDGKETKVTRESGVFRAIHLSGGARRVFMVFRPMAFILGVFVSSVAFVIFIVTAASAAFKILPPPPAR
ncbi:MAG: YfhO family protein [Endomicrobiia bacterium]|nr:YfhO family protein [Endomicrobiia bacterium]